MIISDIANRRLVSQHLLRPDFTSPVEVVRWFGAMQSQDLPASLWAVGLRMKHPGIEGEIEQALADKSIVRSWPMRGTIHLTPAEDAKWMTALLAPRLDAKAAGNYRRAGLTADTIARAGEILTQTLRGGKQCIRTELYSAFNAAGIDTHAQNGEQRGMHLLVHWARHGLICIAPRRGKQQTFALLDEWIPNHRNLTGREAWTELATRYFRSHGPATIKDFAWWTGATITEAKQAAAYIQDELTSAEVDGATYWFTPAETRPTDDRPAFLLPPYDEYTVAYADRSAAVSREQLLAAKHGIAPNLILNGRIAGTWKRVLKRDAVHITLDLLQSISSSQKQLINKAAARYGQFLNLPVSLDL